MLVFMADQINLPAGDLFMGAFIPGLMLAALYVIYILVFSFLKPSSAPLSDNRQSDYPYRTGKRCNAK